MAAKMNERESFLLSGSSPSMVSPTKNSLEGLVYHTHTHTHKPNKCIRNISVTTQDVTLVLAPRTLHLLSHE